MPVKAFVGWRVRGLVTPNWEARWRVAGRAVARYRSAAAHIGTRSSAGSERCPPKAEVTGSNPVGCANDFKDLSDKVTLRKLPFPDYFRIMCSRAVLGRFGNCTAANC
jgi:hypothetical protein